MPGASSLECCCFFRLLVAMTAWSSAIFHVGPRGLIWVVANRGVTRTQNCAIGAGVLDKWAWVRLLSLQCAATPLLFDDADVVWGWSPSFKWTTGGRLKRSFETRYLDQPYHVRRVDCLFAVFAALDSGIVRFFGRWRCATDVFQ